MSVIRVGSTNTYAEGWNAIFGGGTKKTSQVAGKKKAATSTKVKSKKGMAAAGKTLAAKPRRRK